MTTDEMKAALKEQAELLERIAAERLEPATVLAIKDDDVRVASGRAAFVIKQDKKDKLKIGDPILIHVKTSQFVRRNMLPGVGTTLTVSDVIDGMAAVDMGGTTKLFPTMVTIKAGDTVMMDEFDSIVVRVLPPRVKPYAVPETGVTWDDIGGNAHAKAAMIEAIEHPHLHKDLFAFYGAAGAKGILLYGPPGCGKTMLGKAAATSMGASDGFIYSKGPEVLNPYVGVAEATVRGLFSQARDFRAKTGRRAVIFIDEAESILGARGARGSYMEKTIVPTFLAEMDGVSDSGAVVMLATNRSMSLDPAVVRDGRIDRKIEITRPNKEDSVAIAKTHLRKAPTDDADGLSHHLIDTAWFAGFTNGGNPYTFAEVVSGSLIAGIVEKGKTFAMRRDIANGTRTGLKPEDIDGGLRLAMSEMSATSLEVVN
jgi:proteasome-associated ATPase